MLIVWSLPLHLLGDLNCSVKDISVRRLAIILQLLSPSLCEVLIGCGEVHVLTRKPGKAGDNMEQSVVGWFPWTSWQIQLDKDSEPHWLGVITFKSEGFTQEIQSTGQWEHMSGQRWYLMALDCGKPYIIVMENGSCYQSWHQLLSVPTHVWSLF